MIVLDRSSGGVIAESVTGAAFSLNHVNALEHVGVRRWSSVVKPSWSDGDCRTVARVSPGWRERRFRGMPERFTADFSDVREGRPLRPRYARWKARPEF